MKIALLQADHIPKSRRKVAGGNYPEVFSNLFMRIEAIVDIEAFDVTQEQYPSNPKIYDCFIVSGSKAHPYDPIRWIQKLQRYIYYLIDNGHKLIGICFGHQIIAQSLGGVVEYTVPQKGIGIGIQTIRILKCMPWMSPYLEYISLLFNHQDQVVALPEKAEILAYNDFCEIQMYHIDNQILGIQAHPEMLRSHNHELIKAFLADVDQDSRQRAIDTLRIRDHGMLVGIWMMNFVNGEYDKS